MNTNFNAPGRPQGIVAQIVAVVVGALALAVAFTFGLVIFAVVAVAGLIFWLYFLWKTRALRAQIRTQMNEQMRQQQTEAQREPPGFERESGGEIIEGEAVRVVEVERIESSKTSDESR